MVRRRRALLNVVQYDVLSSISLKVFHTIQSHSCRSSSATDLSIPIARPLVVARGP